jgi:hypothetical protein
VNVKAASLTLALVACAAPVATPPPDNAGAYRSPAASGPVTSWLVLARGPAAGTAGTLTFRIDERTPVAQLLVKAVDGAPEIEQIEIEYTGNQGSQIIRLGRALAEGDGQVIELRDRRQISKLIVTTDPDSTGEYIVFGA